MEYDVFADYQWELVESVVNLILQGFKECQDQIARLFYEIDLNCLIPTIKSGCDIVKEKQELEGNIANLLFRMP